MLQRANINLSTFSKIYQIIALFPKGTLLRNVMFSAMGQNRARWNPFIRLDSLTDVVERASDILAQVGLADIVGRLMETSYWERRRSEIAMALVQYPQVLSLDEPFAGLSFDDVATSQNSSIAFHVT